MATSSKARARFAYGAFKVAQPDIGQVEVAVRVTPTMVVTIEAGKIPRETGSIHLPIGYRFSRTSGYGVAGYRGSRWRMLEIIPYSYGYESSSCKEVAK
jgi:hypothetical protein